MNWLASKATLAQVAASRVGRPNPKPRPRLLVKAKRRRGELTKAMQLRRDIRARDGNQCQSCHVPVFLHAANPLQRAQVHHIVFKSKGGSNDHKNLITVCAECHAKIHAHELDVRGTHALDVRFVKVRR
jgi:5-methylcytosine-specific restriction endonuclease McrA